MTVKWNNGAERTVVDFRKQPGFPWQVLDPDGMLDAPTGGGRARETDWGRGERGGLIPRGFHYTGNPNDWTFNVSYPLTAQNFLQRLGECPFDIRVRQRCERPDNMVSYSSPGMLEYVETTNNDYSYSDPLANMDGVAARMKRQLAGVATFEIRATKVAHDDITGQISDADFNRVIGVSLLQCAGDCGIGSTEEDGFWAVTDRDSTPGYSGNPTARFYYRTTKDGSWNSVPIDPFTAADATDVVQAGSRVVAFSPGKAPAYAQFQDILNGVTAPNLWSTSTGLSSLSANNFPAYAVAMNGSTILAVGAGGRVCRSTDGGLSFTIIDNAQTTSNNLLCVDATDDTVAYIGGASGTLLRYVNGTISRVTVIDSSANTLSANINSVRTPPTRTNEVYLGTAGGEIWRSLTALDTVPVFENKAFDRKGEGSIRDLGFVGYRGDHLWVVQSSPAATSRLLRDFSGGNLGNDVEIVGSFVSPSNFGFNSIAMVNVNYGIVGGNIHETYGYLGNIRPA